MAARLTGPGILLVPFYITGGPLVALSAPTPSIAMTVGSAYLIGGSSGTPVPTTGQIWPRGNK